MGWIFDLKISGHAATMIPTITWTILRLASGFHFNLERKNSAAPININMAMKKHRM